MQSMWWFIGAMVFGVAEIFTLDLTLAMLAGGALAAGGVALAGGDLWLSAVVFCVVSALLMFLLRPYLLRQLRKREVLVETNAAALVGASALTIDEITGLAGRVKLNGEVWTARVADSVPTIAEGAEVTVVAIKGATAIVAPKEG